MGKRKMGRPLKLDAKVTANIVLLIKAGNTRRAAAEASGVSKTRFYEWMAQGQLEDKGEYRDFRDAVTQAESEAEVLMVDAIRKAARGYDAIEIETITMPDGTIRTVERRKRVHKPEMAMEWLKRRRSEDWGDKGRLEHTGPGGGPIESVSVQVNTETLDEANRQLAQWREEMKAGLLDGD